MRNNALTSLGLGLVFNCQAYPVEMPEPAPVITDPAQTMYRQMALH